MSNYIYYLGGLIGVGTIGAGVAYCNPELKNKLQKEGIKGSLLAIDNLGEKLNHMKESINYYYSRLMGREGLDSNVVNLEPLGQSIDLNNHFNDLSESHHKQIVKKIDLIADHGFKVHKITHFGKIYKWFLPSELEADTSALVTEFLENIESNEYLFEGWLSVEIEIQNKEGDTIFKSGELLNELDHLIFEGNILPIISKYNHFWISEFNLHENIKGHNYNDLKIIWKVVTDNIIDIQLNNHLVIIHKSKSVILDI